MGRRTDGQTDWREWHTLAERVRGRRTMLNMSQADLARAAHVHQGDISKLENGTTVRPRYMAELAAALHCEAYWLARGQAAPGASRRQQLSESPWPADAPEPAVAIEKALPVVLDALAAVQDREYLRDLLQVLARRDSPHLRAQLTELLGG